MARGLKPTKYGPHDFNKGRNWFYVNTGSVDVCDGQSIMRLPREALHRMLASLKPLQSPKRKPVIRMAERKRAG